VDEDPQAVAAVTTYYEGAGAALRQSWAASNDIELVFLPTDASWLNWIEVEFAALRSFALTAPTIAATPSEPDAIAGYMRWRNARANPNTTSPDSAIRT
jgi:hypothetical protein